MVLPFVEVIETGSGTRRLPPSFEKLLETTRRAHGLQAEILAQIETAWDRVRQAKAMLVKLDAMASTRGHGPGG